MYDHIECVSQKFKIPKWWVESIAIEYTDCRDFAIGRDIWTFNFDKVSIEELENSIKSHKIIIHNYLIHNVHIDTFRSRFAHLLASRIRPPLVNEQSDFIPEGLVSDFYFPFIVNSIEQWDPKLGFSNYCQIYDNGQLYQWKIANFVKVEGRHYGKWVSDIVDLEPLDKMQQELQILRNNKIKPGEEGYDEFKKKIEDYYNRLDVIRRPILNQLLKYHSQKIQLGYASSKVLMYDPPLLSHFERFTIKDNDLYTTFYAEPIFYRACYYHAKKAEELANSLNKDIALVDILDEIYQERAIAIILGAVCFEAFINGLGFDQFPSIWKQVERLPTDKKCKLYYELSNKSNSLFNKGKEPYKSIYELIEKRDLLVHFKRGYNKSINKNDEIITDTENLLSREFVRDLPDKLREVIIELCNINKTPIPEWLTPQPNLMWME